VPDGIEGDLDVVTIKQDPGGTRVSAMLGTEDRKSVAGVHGYARYQHIVEKHGLDPLRLADFFEVEGLAAHGADIVITEQPDLLLARDRDLHNDLPVMTPEEAFVVVGVWSRLIHKAWVTGPVGLDVGSYYRSLAHALTPAARPFFASASGQTVLVHSGEIYEFWMSVLECLTRLARGLDQMVTLWQCPSDNEVNDELLADFDEVIRDVWRVYDNLALLCGYYLDITLDHDKRWWRLCPTRQPDSTSPSNFGIAPPIGRNSSQSPCNDRDALTRRGLSSKATSLSRSSRPRRQWAILRRPGGSMKPYRVVYSTR
jgi:hypothetical protein